MFSFKKASKILIFMFSMLCGISVLLLLWGAQNDSFSEVDYAVVYGSKVNEDGTLSERLKARLDGAVYLYQENRVSGVVVSGGLGKEGFDEGNVMGDYLKSIGVENIVVDSYGNNSHMTSVNSKNLIGESKSVVAISQYFHIPRAKLSLRNAGFKEVYGYSPSYYELRDIYSLTREVPAYIKYYITDK